VGFQLKQFFLEDAGAAMKLGTDAVLLGAWAPFAQNATLRILDVGTGSGILALMLAQRFPHARIHAIELDPQATRQAQSNFQNSPFASRLSVECINALDFSPSHLYDTIICNPPFFEENHQITDRSRATARQTLALSEQTLHDLARKWLHPSGQLALIKPAITSLSGLHYPLPFEIEGLWLNRATIVYPQLHAKNPIRVLQSFTKGLLITPKLDILTLGSAEYLTLVQDFYLEQALKQAESSFIEGGYRQASPDPPCSSRISNPAEPSPTPKYP
jgi:tRNA1Val (adenine37-N6)-methyltransferase